MAPSARKARTAGAGGISTAITEESILARIQVGSIAGLTDEVRCFLDLPSSGARVSKENQGHSRAKKVVPFLGRLLKVCNAELRKIPADGDSVGYQRGDNLFRVMRVALDSLDELRTWLASGLIEIELQRYAFVRRLVLWKRQREAADECRKILKSLEDRVFLPSKDGNAKNGKCSRSKELVFPSPTMLNTMVPGLPVLVVGLATDLILYSVEGGERDINVLDNLISLPLQLEPWLSVMDAKDQVTQCDAVFKALYKSTSILIAERLAEEKILYNFGILSLIWCCVSSQGDQYLKVARKFCSGITSFCENVSLEICSFVIASLQTTVTFHLANENILKESVLNIQKHISNSSGSLDELRGLVSFIYNMGVQSFNKKEYDSACRPLKLAHDGAWIRVDFLAMMSNVHVVEAVSEACLKTSAYVECLVRNREDVMEILRNSLVYWLRVHSQGFTLESPQTVLKLWCKVTLDSAPDLCCLYGSLNCLEPPVPAASLGALLEEQLLALDGTEKHGGEQVKEDIIGFLADEVYRSGSFVIERSRVLIEKGRIARKKGTSNLGTAIALLSKALILVENGIKAGESSLVDEKKAELSYYSVVTYCLRAHCSHEADPFSEDCLVDLDSAIKSSKILLDFIKDGVGIPPMRRESLLFLLRNAADLLALKAMTRLQDEIQLLIYEIILCCQGSSLDQSDTSIWENARTSHVLCPVPFPWHLDTILQQKFEKRVDILYNFKKPENSLAAAATLLLSADSSQRHVMDIDTALVSARASPSNFRERVYLSGLQFCLAEVFAQKGELVVAAKLATDSLQLRLKLLNRTFLISKNDGQASNTKVEAVGPSSVLTWPSFLRRDTCYEFSQWHVFGDYIESLMQVGTLYEKLGVSDEADKSFREGLWLARSQNLTFASICFSSALAEVHRKQHLWDRAEEGFADTEKMLEDPSMAEVCARCITMERCHLQLRLGDFARHSPVLDEGILSNSRTKLDISLMHYKSAIKASLDLPFLPDVLNGSKNSSSEGYRKFCFRDITLSSWTDYKWEYYSRRLAAQLYIEQGSCRFQLEDMLKAEESYQHAIHLLSVELNISQRSLHPTTKASLFPHEEASLLYNWSILRLREQPDGGFNHAHTSMQYTWLYRAYFLSNAAHVMFKKVCQLLAILHVLMLATDNSREAKELAAYFHQASVGSMSRQQHLLAVHSKMQQGDAPAYLQEMGQVLRVVQEGSTDFRAAFKGLLDGLPPATVCCISVVEQELSFMLTDLNIGPVVASLLVSRIGGGDVVVTILPIGCTSGPDVEVSQVSESRCTHKTVLESDPVVRGIMGELASILDESRQSTSRRLPVSTPEEKNQWWKWRTELDTRLAACLRRVENNWFGFWKCLLLGEPVQSSLSEAFRKKSKELCRTLKSRNFLGQTKAGKLPEESLVKVLLQAVGSLEDEQLCQGVAFILGWSQNSSFGEKEALVERAAELFRSAKELVAENFEREPTELVLDGRLQPLPWESFPVLRVMEIYRMPSLGSLKAVYIHHKSLRLELEVCDGIGRLRLNAKGRRNIVEVSCRPVVNPHSTFYLLNPGGDLESTQLAFEEWFRRQKGWEGKAGEVPTIAEYLAAFQEHEMFVYLGHGSGDQYFPEKHMRNLAHCPASLLMGCSSGRFSARGDYEPVGVPLSYLMACCPLAIANLWDVTDGDIDRFSRALLQRWLESSDDASTSAQPATTTGKASRRGRSSSSRTGNDTTLASEAWEEVSIGPSIQAGREACRLPYLIGASPVCFGVPTIIRRKKTDSIQT